ncbi:type II toxin-antitoxin system VapC family toxin [Saezia sanguinis]|nr:type II toxin-antitoxin system VapC family toxin [Saezia sanguinis]
MLDTNTVSHFIRQNPQVTKQIVAAPLTSLCISAITEGELLYGLAKRPEAKKLHQLVHEFLKRVDTLAWDMETAGIYGKLRAEMESKGKVLAPLDMMIAAHALTVGAVLVTNDHAFLQVPKVHTEDWSA